MSADKENCDVCTKAVYPTERLAADGKVFHKSCFRCKNCNGVLKLGTYASMDGIFYDKPCFKKLFTSKGNYSQGFGKLTPQQEHDLKSGKISEPQVGTTQEGDEEETADPAKEEVDSSITMSVKANIFTQAVEQATAHPAPAASAPAATPVPTTAAAAPAVSAPANTQAAAATNSGKTISHKCHVCAKTVYQMEELKADDLVFHKGCFRCKNCNGVLKLGTYASMGGVFYDKPCFKKLFSSKGNYSEGFGLLKPQQEFDLKTGKSTNGFGIAEEASAVTVEAASD